MIDSETGWVYWSQALAPGQITTNFLDSLKLDNAPKDVSLYYAIHTNLEAVDYNEIDTMAPPQGIEDAWKKKQRFTVTFNTNGGSEVTSFKVAADELVTEPAVPTKAGSDFIGWYAKEDLTGKAWNFATDKMPAKNLTLYAKWEGAAIARVYFKEFTGATEVLPAKKITESDKDLTIPDAPKENYYFLGWAEAPNAAKTQTLYVPAGDTAIQGKLNAPDQTYLGYAVKPSHEIKNITADKTLYAVYYKKLKATGLADSANPTAQEFIWNDAIWRVVNTTATNPSLRLVVKASGLMQSEVEAAMPSFTFEPSGQFAEKEDGNAVRVHFQTQESGTVDDKQLFFNSSNDDGYGRSRVKAIIDAYYNHLTDKTAVQAVTLNNPTWTQYTGTGYTGASKTSYNNWGWGTDSEDGNRNKHYRDARFETTLGGSKQAFALSFGDIHGVIGVPTTPGNYTSPLLNFVGTNFNTYWLRSAGQATATAGRIGDGILYFANGMDGIITVRPSLYLSVD